MPDTISDETRQSIIDALDNGDKTQSEIADKHDVSQSTVSNLNQSYNAGKDKGRKEGYKDGVKDTFNFDREDETEVEEDDEYWCQKCKDEGNGTVHVDHLDAECPNGHDLSGAWDQ